jgi:hypothetical protein
MRFPFPCSTPRKVLALGLSMGAALAFSQACSQAPPSAASDVMDAGSDGSTAIAEVHGRRVRHVWTEAGVYDEPLDLSRTKISAFVTHDDGTIDTYAGAGLGDGSFIVKSVPNVPFSLQMDTTVYVHLARESVIETFVVGRTDVKTLDPNAWIVVHLWNLNPWPATQPRGTPFFVYTLNAGGVWDLGSSGADFLSVNPGDTAVVDVNIRGLGRVAVDSSRGDRSRVLQYADRASTSGAFSALVRTLDLPDLTLVGGGRVEGAMVEVAASETLTADWKGSAFGALMVRSGRGAQPARANLGVYARPNAPPSFEGGGVGLLVGVVPPGDAAITMPYGDPFGGLERWSSVHYTTTLTLSVPNRQGRATDVLWGTDLHQTARVASSAIGEVTPMIGPVVDVRINGADAFVDALQASDTPTLSWSAGLVPSGARPRYLVDVVDLTDPNKSLVLSLWTSEASVRIPPGLLAHGRFYVAQITSAPTTGSRFASAPSGDAVGAEASFVTGLMSP